MKQDKFGFKSSRVEAAMQEDKKKKKKVFHRLKYKL